MALRSARWTFSTMAISITCRSSSSRTTAGTVCRPTLWLARQRRSPATISNRPLGRGRTRIGCSTPRSRIELVSSSMSSSRNTERGWEALGSIRSMGTSRMGDRARTGAPASTASAAAASAAFSSSASPNRADRPRPRPLRFSAMFRLPACWPRPCGAGARGPRPRGRASDRPGCRRISDHRPAPACRRTGLPRPAHCAG